jgi:hypothetical protein
MSKLNLIKLVHTIIWLFFNLVIFNLLYLAVTRSNSKLIWVDLGFILLEGVILVVYKMKCPLTVMARKYSDSTKDNFDIYLPAWLAKNNKLIYTSIVLAALVILIYNRL